MNVVARHCGRVGVMAAESMMRGWPRLLLLLVLATLTALFVAPPKVLAEEGFLEPDKAFRFNARVADSKQIEISFDIAPGYYMYREQFKFDARGATLGDPVIPKGHIKFDDTFQKDVETYRDKLLIQVPFEQAGPRFTVDVVHQGCSDRGLCYSPSVSHAEVRLGDVVDGHATSASVRILPTTPYMPGAGGGLDITGGSASVEASSSIAGRVNTASPADSPRIGDGIESALQSGRISSVVGVFLLAGVLLSLTPCVLPMLPILSSIIVGDQARAVSPAASREASSGKPAWALRGRAFGLALSYSLGMALVYTALGVAAGLAGEGLAAALQTPWVLGLFALGLAALAMSMFGVYELQLPSSWTSKVTEASGRLKGGRAAGVFVMGGLSALIVSPCVAAPLAGALVYISQTKDAWLGGAALFSLAAGMSVPLLLIGASAGTLLPRAGPWMEGVKRLFGVLLLAVAVWTVQPVLPASAALGLWGVLLVGCAVALGLPKDKSAGFRSLSLPRKAAAVIVAIFGVMQLVGAASGGADPLQPLAHLARSGSAASGSGTSSLPFVTIKTSADLDQALRTSGRVVMLDFYADWCVSCKEMERFTFTDDVVRSKLANVLLLKADVTRNSPEDRELLRRFNLFGPPGTLFFDPSGNEFLSNRVIGFQSAERFTQTLQSVGL